MLIFAMCNYRLIFLSLVFLCIDKICFAQAKTDSVLQNILFGGQGKILQDVLHYKDSFRVQIIYTRIDRDKNNNPSFASTVKLPLALLSLEKLNRLNKKDISKYTSLQIDSNYSWQTPVYRDSNADEVISYESSIRLKKFFKSSDILITLNGQGHNGITDNREYIQEIKNIKLVVLTTQLVACGFLGLV